MSDQTSLLKARYCRSILGTAANGPDEEARRLIECLGTELPTSNTSHGVKVAERDALAAILTLSERFQDRSSASVSTEWRSAMDAILRWIVAAE